MNLLAIDPGPEKSAWVIIKDGVPVESGWDENDEVLSMIVLTELDADEGFDNARFDDLVIEKVVSYGMGVGESIFETVYWTGIFAMAFNLTFVTRIPRLDVKVALCHDAKAKKGNVNQAIKDHYDTINPVGTKKNQGPLYEFARKHGPGLTHRWDALAVGLTYLEQQKLTPNTAPSPGKVVFDYFYARSSIRN